MPLVEFNQRLTRVAASLIGNSCPAYVYHYTNTKALINILKSRRLWATQSGYLNDPNEIARPFEMFGERARIAMHDFPIGYTELVSSKICNEIQSRIFLTSFTTEPDTQSIWRLYGKSDGYNIMINSKLLLESTNINIINKNTLNPDSLDEIQKSAFFIPVVYDEEKQIKLIDFFISELSESAKNANRIGAEEFNIIQNHIIRQAIAYLVGFKDASYEHEREYRLVIIPTDHEVAEDYYDREGVICPFIEYSINGALPINGITVGPKINDNIAIKGLERLCSKYKWNLPETSITHSKAKVRF